MNSPEELSSNDVGTILIVDDTPENLDVLSAMLSNSGWEVLVAIDGISAVKQALYARPDLILLDVMMEGLDGFETCLRLKSSPDTAEIPVIFITALSEVKDKIKGFKLGAVDYVTKPFHFEEIHARVKTHLTLRRMQQKLQQLNQELSLRVQERSIALAEAQAFREEAEKANRAKGDFLASMSHELRTPLNAILGYAQILQRYSLPAAAQKGVQTIFNSGSHLLTLINDILDLSKIEARKMELYPVPIHFPAFLRRVVEIGLVQAAQKNIEFLHEFSPDLPNGAIVDEKRLRQVLLNLLGNAIKFTDRGKVTFAVTCANPHNHTVTFCITDTGVGMTPEQQRLLFRNFQQVGDSRRKAEGTGLGLSISQKLVQMMGGEIQVESTYGEGSRFWFTVSFAIAQAVAPHTQPSSRAIGGYRGPRKKIAIVDDKPENLDILTGLLLPLGFELVEAQNGLEALSRIETECPDLVITDLVMPVMDGFELVRLLRQHPSFAATPIIASSASVFQSDKDSSLQIGCNGFLSKPVHADELYAWVAKLLQLEWLQVDSVDANFVGANFIGANYIDANSLLAETCMRYPSREAIEELRENTIRGSLKKVLHQVQHLEKQEPRWQAFCRAVRGFAESFEDEALVNFLQAVLDRSTDDSVAP